MTTDEATKPQGPTLAERAVRAGYRMATGLSCCIECGAFVPEPAWDHHQLWHQTLRGLVDGLLDQADGKAVKP